MEKFLEQKKFSQTCKFNSCQRFQLYLYHLQQLSDISIIQSPGTSILPASVHSIGHGYNTDTDQETGVYNVQTGDNGGGGDTSQVQNDIELVNCKVTILRMKISNCQDSKFFCSTVKKF